ncbi:MAG: hypothetical protein LUG66_00440 [Clostridiales bacterium]|nr:hypothetical protein [Clostridiales bacterium]
MDSNVFCLMHKDDVAAVLSIDSISGNIVKIAKKCAPELLPLGGQKSPEELKKWWARRAVPIAQGNIKKLLMSADIPTTQNLLVRNLGLSLTDHYWIKPIDSGLTWKDVNLYENDFKDKIAELNFCNTIADLDEATSFYSGSSLQGELEKRWIIGGDGRRFLVKGNYGNSSQQSGNEVIATLLHSKQKRFPYTEYKFCTISSEYGSKIGCISQNFTDVNTEFIPAYEVINSVKKKNDVSDYEHFINVCEQNGLDSGYVRSFLEYQILTDFIITNTDRHYNNFGILRNSENLKFVDAAPIFDSGNSMFWNNPKMPLYNDLTNIKVSGFRGIEKDMLGYITSYENADLNLLPSNTEIEKILQYVNMAEEDISAIVLGYNKKIEMLSKYKQEVQ